MYVLTERLLSFNWQRFTLHKNEKRNFEFYRKIPSSTNLLNYPRTLKNLIYPSFFFFFFFDLGFTALSRIFHLYRADRSSKVGENRRTRRKTTWPSVSRKFTPLLANSADDKLMIFFFLFFLIFLRKQVSTFHANGLQWMETIGMKCQNLFSGKII